MGGLCEDIFGGSIRGVGKDSGGEGVETGGADSGNSDRRGQNIGDK